MVKVRALGLVRGICGWQEKTVEADNMNEVMESLPAELSRLVKNGDVLILINGSEYSSVLKDKSNLNDKDEVVLLPVVHGGVESSQDAK